MRRGCHKVDGSSLGTTTGSNNADAAIWAPFVSAAETKQPQIQVSEGGGAEGRNYSMRRPDVARTITSCWISLVPSKIVWIFASRVYWLFAAISCTVTRRFANGRFHFRQECPSPASLDQDL